MAELRVLEPGMLTSVQDRGRFGYQDQGVPPAGAMDEYALRAVNALCGNSIGEAVLEFTMFGGSYEFVEGGSFALAGADMGARLNEQGLPLWQQCKAEAGDRLTLGWARRGCRLYLGILGGIDVPLVLGSRSTYLPGKFGGFHGRKLATGDELYSQFGWEKEAALTIFSPDWIPSYESSLTARVMLGPQQEYFTEKGIATFLQNEYSITSQADRMGYRLEGQPIQIKGGADILTDGVPAGAVQVQSEGQPLLLLADRQTTGGYAKIACVIGADLWRLGQARPGDSIHFQAVGLAEAQVAWRDLSELWNRWVRS
jgi:antagonist of KipI